MTTPEPRLARVAAMIADPARSRMLAYLLSGEFASAGELAVAASVTPATASGHLRRLLDADFIVCAPRGRHRYYRLAGPEIAHALEALALVAERAVHERQWAGASRERLREARCCYGHIAGRLGVLLFDALNAQHGLRVAGDGGFELTDSGRDWMATLGLHAAEASGRRRYAYACLDWSERRDHLAGQLAEQIHQHLSARGWLRRGEARALEVTPTGRQQLLPLLQRAAASSMAK